MKADVYRTKKSSTYLFLPHGTNPESVPEAVRRSLGSLRLWKTIGVNERTIAADPAKVRADFQKQGYSIPKTEVSFDVSTDGKKLIFKALKQTAAGADEFHLHPEDAKALLRLTSDDIKHLGYDESVAKKVAEAFDVKYLGKELLGVKLVISKDARRLIL